MQFIGDENLRFTEEEARAIKDAERASSPSLTYTPDIRIPFPQQDRIPFNPHQDENFREMYQTFSERISNIIQGHDNPILTAVGVIIWLGVTAIFGIFGLIWIAYKILAFFIPIIINIANHIANILFWTFRNIILRHPYRALLSSALIIVLVFLLHQTKHNSLLEANSEIKAVKRVSVANAIRRTRLYGFDNKPKEFLKMNDKRNIIGNLKEHYIIQLKGKEKRLIKMEDVELLNLPTYH